MAFRLQYSIALLRHTVSLGIKLAKPAKLFVDNIVWCLQSDLLHQKDYAIRCLCDDKFNASLELLELFAKDEIFGGVSIFTSRSSRYTDCVLTRSK